MYVTQDDVLAYYVSMEVCMYVCMYVSTSD